MLNATLLVIASMTVGADPEPTAFDHLKDLQCFNGVWEAEATVPESPANSENIRKWAGEKYTLRLTFNWAPQKNAQMIEAIFEIPDKVKITETAIRGWDQSAGKLKEYSFTTHLGVWSGTTTKVGDKWVTEYSGFNLDGAECSGTRTAEFKNKDAWVMKDTKHTVNGELTPDLEYHFTRVVPPTNHDHLQGLTFLIGSWKATHDDGSTTTWSFEWAQNKNVIDNLLATKDANGNVVTSNKGMLVWDNYTQQVVNACFDQEGNSRRYLWTPQDDGSWKTSAAGSGAGWPVVKVSDDQWKVGDIDDGGMVFTRIDKAK